MTEQEQFEMSMSKSSCAELAVNGYTDAATYSNNRMAHSFVSFVSFVNSIGQVSLWEWVRVWKWAFHLLARWCSWQQSNVCFLWANGSALGAYSKLLKLSVCGIQIAMFQPNLRYGKMWGNIRMKELAWTWTRVDLADANLLEQMTTSRQFNRN